jgi:hypothetical protein
MQWRLIVPCSCSALVPCTDLCSAAGGGPGRQVSASSNRRSWAPCDGGPHLESTCATKACSRSLPATTTPCTTRVASSHAPQRAQGRHRYRGARPPARRRCAPCDRGLPACPGRPMSSPPTQPICCRHAASGQPAGTWVTRQRRCCCCCCRCRCAPAAQPRSPARPGPARTPGPPAARRLAPASRGADRWRSGEPAAAPRLALLC